MKNKKVLIFDFDGTFYTGDQAFSKIENYVNKNKRKFLPNLTNEQYKKIVKENPTWKDVYVGADVVNFIYMLKKKYTEYKISVKDFWNWQESKPDPLVIDKNQVVDVNFLKNICQQYPTYVVSNSSPNHVTFYMKKLKINPNWFKAIISNHFIAKDRTKQHYYEKILQQENCLPQNCFVFGDSMQNDLIPAQKLNINTYLITDANDIPNTVLNALNK